MRKGRFPPLRSVLPEFKLWEAVLRQFLAFFDFGVVGHVRVRAFRFSVRCLMFPHYVLVCFSHFHSSLVGLCGQHLLIVVF